MDLEKPERIKAEIVRLAGVYRGLPQKHKAAVDGLIKRAAFMRVTLEDMELDLDTDGFVEEFTQSEKLAPYDRERPVARLYNAMNKNYQSITKQLTDLLPDIPPPAEKEDALDKHINNRPV